MSESSEKISPVTTEDNDPIAQAIASLTAAARETRVIGAGTPNEHREPVDFGEIACHVLTAVAANMGGVDRLLAGRPGSWEADYVRQIVNSTAGSDDEDLVRYRTEPVRVNIYVDLIFQDFGLEELYEEAADELARPVDDADQALFEAVATDDEKSRLAVNIAARQEIEDAFQAGGERPAIELESALWDEAHAIIRAVQERAAADGHPTAAALAAAAARNDAVHQLWEQDQGAYLEAYTATLRRLLAERGMSVDIEVAVENVEWSELEDNLHTAARAVTPLPMTGEWPDWSDGTPADALRRAGLTYAARVNDPGGDMSA